MGSKRKVKVQLRIKMKVEGNDPSWIPMAGVTHLELV